MTPNNFDLLRLLLASIVVYFHAWLLSGSPALYPFHVLSGHLAVECFFVISGFLIFASYDRSKSLRDYYVKRARRILPGYWLSTAICVAIAVYFSHALHVGKFLLANLTFLNFLSPGVPGVFSGNANPALNGALWTIKIEVLFYMLVPVLVWLCRRFGKLQVLIPTILLSLVYRKLTEGHGSLALQLPGQMSYFAGGALGYYYLPQFKQYGNWLVAPAVLCYLLHRRYDIFVLRPIAFTVLVLAFCFLLPEIKGPTRWGDFSYGVYVLHWPLIQMLVAFGVFQRSIPVALAAVTVLVYGCAVLSWYLVERRWLKSRHKPASPGPVKAYKQAALSSS